MTKLCKFFSRRYKKHSQNIGGQYRIVVANMYLSLIITEQN